MEPTISGTRGRAWDARTFKLPPNPPPDWTGYVGQYVANVPGAHPLWQWWMISAIHLRPIDGVQPAKLSRPTSTHEFIILSMNPECGAPDLDDFHAWLDGTRTSIPRRTAYLSPPDLVFQVDDATDEMTAEACRLLVKSFCDGTGSPDSDFRRFNEQAILATLAHMREGKHIPQ